MPIDAKSCLLPSEVCKRLGISLSKLAFLVRQESIRMAVMVPHLNRPKRVLHLESLSRSNQIVVGFIDPYRLLTEWVAESGDRCVTAPTYLYIDFSRRVIRWAESPEEYKAVIFENFQGEPVTLLDDEGYLEFLYLGTRDEFGFYSDACFTVIEIERFLAAQLEVSEPTGEHSRSEKKNDLDAVESEPSVDQNNGISSAEEFAAFCADIDKRSEEFLVGFGNAPRNRNSSINLCAACRAYKLYYGIIPDSKQLIQFMKRYAKTTDGEGRLWDWYVWPDGTVSVEPMGGGESRQESLIERSIDELIKKMIKEEKSDLERRG